MPSGQDILGLLPQRYPRARKLFPVQNSPSVLDLVVGIIYQRSVPVDLPHKITHGDIQRQLCWAGTSLLAS